MTTKTKRPFLKLECKTCKRANYHIPIVKGKMVEKDKMELNKFCNTCRKHTAHKMKFK